jgi:phosphoribosyl 1,2-cyclic phosphodiesterase
MTETSKRGRKSDAQAIDVTFWGVRGSIPVPGPEVQGFGGNTMCLEIGLGGRRVIVDAGSGLRTLGARMVAEHATSVDLLLTHLHLDHLIGLTMFAPLFKPGFELRIHAPRLRAKQPAADALHALFGEPYLPYALGRVASHVTIETFDPGDVVDIAGLAVRTTLLNHPGGASGYRFDTNEAALAVITDNEHDGAKPTALGAFCRDAGLILYDAAWCETADYDGHRGWGHSTWQGALRLLEAAQARAVGCMHHAPEASDEVLAAREGKLKAAHAASFFAREGERVRVGANGPTRFPAGRARSIPEA